MRSLFYREIYVGAAFALVNVLYLTPYSFALSTNVDYGGRHLCLFDDIANVQGPYFSALFDQLYGETQLQRKNLAFCTTRLDLEKLVEPSVFLDDLKSSLDLDDIKIVILDDLNPLTTERIFQKPNSNEEPTIIWVQGQNAFFTRHLLRTSGVDRMVQERCAPNASSPATIFVGEGAGALCAGSTMAVAYVKDDPSLSPELQVQGLGLLGEGKSGQFVSFGVERDALEKHAKTHAMVEQIHICRSDQVFVWSQSSTSSIPSGDAEKLLATRFIMTPHRRGMIEKYTTPDMLPPVITNSHSTGSDGVPCPGEPSVDPSRAVQQIGDSEWLEEYIS
jgi:peptidase E